MRRIVIVGALALLLLAAACGGGGNAGSKATSTANMTIAAYSTEKALPPPTSAPSPTPLIAGPEVRPCGSADVATNVRGQGYTGGGRLTYIEIGNHSNTPCQISGPPDLQFLDAGGQVLPVNLIIGSSCPPPGDPFGGTSPFCIFQQPLLLLPDVEFGQTGVRRGQVLLTLDWHAFFDTATGICHTPPPRVTQVRLFPRDTDDEVLIDLIARPWDGLSARVPEGRRNGIAPCDGTVVYWGYGPGTAD